ncbi:AAA family ATPase [Ferruginibacter sp. SUN106]|uniref:AAA family ATPase n=1 Tax=Ferruginibacter sp. SUN106 TaxID=2978348 RepID=UPI003D35B8F8
MGPIILVLGMLLLIWMIPDAKDSLQNIWRQIKQKFIRNKNASIFESYYIEVKAFYIKEFKATPCISAISNIDATKAYEYINSGLAGKIMAIYQRNYYSWQDSRQNFGTTVFKLENKVLVKLSDEYAEVLFGNSNYEYANALITAFAAFKVPEKEDPFEINIITQTSTGLDLKQLEIKPTVLDIDLYYNDDFKPIDAIIKQRLEKENDKGIILLHGLPGTGKTTYLRHLIGSMKKKVLFVSPGVAGNLMNPEFIDLLIDNPNAVLIIEDAENIIMDRKFSSNSSVSNLLNISDGLLSDCLNVQIICTFNSALSMVDSALLRKGRLIAKYEFDKLNASKAQRLSDHLGFKNKIHKCMTIAEITNPDDMEVEKPAMQVMGFRREAVMN